MTTERMNLRTVQAADRPVSFYVLEDEDGNKLGTLRFAQTYNSSTGMPERRLEVAFERNFNLHNITCYESGTNIDMRY